MLIFQPSFSYQTCIVKWLRCGANLIEIEQKLHKLVNKNLEMMTEWRKRGMTDRLKTVYPAKLRMRGYNKTAQNWMSISSTCKDSSMQGLNTNEWKLLELLITQCKHPKGGLVVIMSKFNTPKNIIKCTQNRISLLQCVNTRYAKFE